MSNEREKRYIDGYNLDCCLGCSSFDGVFFDIKNNEQVTRIACNSCGMYDLKWYDSCFQAAEAWNHLYQACNSYITKSSKKELVEKIEFAKNTPAKKYFEHLLASMPNEELRQAMRAFMHEQLAKTMAVAREEERINQSANEELVKKLWDYHGACKDAVGKSYINNCIMEVTKHHSTQSALLDKAREALEKIASEQFIRDDHSDLIVRITKLARETLKQMEE